MKLAEIVKEIRHIARGLTAGGKASYVSGNNGIAILIGRAFIQRESEFKKALTAVDSAADDAEKALKKDDGKEDLSLKRGPMMYSNSEGTPYIFFEGDTGRGGTVSGIMAGAGVTKLDAWHPTLSELMNPARYQRGRLPPGVVLAADSKGNLVLDIRHPLNQGPASDVNQAFKDVKDAAKKVDAAFKKAGVTPDGRDIYVSSGWLKRWAGVPYKDFEGPEAIATLVGALESTNWPGELELDIDERRVEQAMHWVERRREDALLEKKRWDEHGFEKVEGKGTGRDAWGRGSASYTITVKPEAISWVTEQTIRDYFKGAVTPQIGETMKVRHKDGPTWSVDMEFYGSH